MRDLFVDLLIRESTAQGSETQLAYKEVLAVMDYLDTYWLNNPTILRAFIDGPFLHLDEYETTDNIVEGFWRWFDGE